MDSPVVLDLTELERLAVEVAVEAGRLITDDRPADVSAAATKSSPTDVVTIMDTRAEELIRARLLAARPDDSILGEEGDDHVGSSAITWVVDPIDGTVNYLYEIPAYAVSIAAVTGDPRVPGEWTVLVAAVGDPCRDRVYHARLGGGAHLSRTDGEVVSRLAVGGVPQLGGATATPDDEVDRSGRRCPVRTPQPRGTRAAGEGSRPGRHDGCFDREQG